MERRTYKLRKRIILSGLVLLFLWMVLVWRQSSNSTLVTPTNKDEHQPQQSSLTPDAEEEMLLFAKHLGKQGKPMAVAIANNVYVRLAHSWLCNTEVMGIHDQIMIIVPDELSRSQLKRKWPNVHVFKLSSELGDITGPRDYTTVGFQRVTYFRAQTVLKILQNHVDVFVFEFDCVWFENPIPLFHQKLQSGDIAAVKVSGHKHQVAIGLLYIRSTNNTIAVWKEINRQMKKLLDTFKTASNSKLVAEGLNDQVFLENMIRQGFSNLQIVHMDSKVFADGVWYKDKDRNPNPVLINNNWIIGPDKKVERAIKYKHWFWDMEREKCDTDLVNKTVRLKKNLR